MRALVSLVLLITVRSGMMVLVLIGNDCDVTMARYFYEPMISACSKYPLIRISDFEAVEKFVAMSCTAGLRNSKPFSVLESLLHSLWCVLSPPTRFFSRLQPFRIVDLLCGFRPLGLVISAELHRQRFYAGDTAFGGLPDTRICRIRFME